jgi:hypothetical protein
MIEKIRRIMDEKRKVDSSVFTTADIVCDGYYMRDPGYTRKDAQKAAIAAMKGTRALDARHKIGFENSDPFATNRLIDLGVNPKTLKIKHKLFPWR